MLPLIFFFLFSHLNVLDATVDGGRNIVARGESPLTAKASVIRYWNKHISNDLPKPWFLLNKASPLDAVHVAKFSKLADQKALSTQLPAFCSKANILCSSDMAPNGDGDGGESFNNYGSSAPGTVGEFTQYSPGLEFTTYSSESPGRVQLFSTYTDTGDESFSNYAEDANGAVTEFEVYGENSDAKGSHFSNYAVTGNGAVNTFTSYRNTPKSSFRNYGNGALHTFMDYRQLGIGENATLAASLRKSGQYGMVEPGMFFREENLRTGTIMPMPDIKDKMPKRSFLPRVIASKLPFSVSEIPELHQILDVKENSTMAKTIKHTLTECERAPSKGEIKRCVAAVEDMVNFATSILGRNSVVRTTENTAGSKGDILIGSVNRINGGGNVTKAVSCHQSLFPYLVYYCHSVPNVRVYEADILDPETKNKINHGVAICHLDTSSWSPTHKAFIALWSVPGKIEVCHWIFENDMTWAVADLLHSY